jgi:mycothiol synthase
VSVHRRRDGTWELDVSRDGLRASADYERRLLEVALAQVAAGGGGPVARWVDEADRVAAEACEALGMRADRELWQMRRALPLGEPPSITVRPFRPRLDDEAWLEVNNAAFAWHPDQAGWTLRDLHARMAEPWFDPAGFLLHEDDQGRLIGFCWTKVHTQEDPPVGEIFVIGVHPDAHGRGLGRELSLAGLDHLGRQGLRWAMLYVDATNAPAVALYRRHGFVVHRVQHRYVGHVPASP